MTLIVATLLNDRAYMLCDKMHSIDSKDGNPINVDICNGDSQFKITAEKIRITTGTKIYKIGQENALVGGAGDLLKVQNYIENIKNKTSDMLSETYTYYSNSQNPAPEQLILMPNKTVCYYFAPMEDPTFKIFVNYRYEFVKNQIGVVAIGSGAKIFLTMYEKIRKTLNNSYIEALAKNELETWIKSYQNKFVEMYHTISLYDDNVSSEVEIYEMR